LVAVPAFNVYTLGQAAGVVDACSALGRQAILQVSARTLGDLLAPTVVGLRRLANDASVDVRIHLDHASVMEISAALELPFDSVMVDGSLLPVADNIRISREAVTLARSAGFLVEGELGRLSGAEDGITALVGTVTDPTQVRRFVSETGVDSLAVSVGNVHGRCNREPTIDFVLLEEIRRVCAVPLVLHGASGLSTPALRHAIRLGVAKVNVNTEIRLPYAEALGADSELQSRLSGARYAARDAALAFLDRFGQA
jgi:ketose-bisphosphate aldolase